MKMQTENALMRFLKKETQNNFLNIVGIIFYISLLMTARIVYAEEISYSLFDCKNVPLDKKLQKLMNYKGGIFIEVGAHNGVEQSNTKLFEDCYDWTGVLVEPSPSLFPLLVANRPHSKCFQCALGSFEENNTYILGDFEGTLMDSVGGMRLKTKPPTQKVLVRSLQSILDEVGITHVNFFSLDTEGYELNILKGIDFNKTTFDYLLIEIYKNQYEEIIAFLSSFKYELVENFTNYNTQDNPFWDGTHNDYLFKRID